MPVTLYVMKTYIHIQVLRVLMTVSYCAVPRSSTVALEFAAARKAVTLVQKFPGVIRSSLASQHSNTTSHRG
jgi:hypothetical protein